MNELAAREVPAADRCVVRNLLEQRAAENPDKVYALFPVPNELSEDEVLAVVAIAPGATLDHQELFELLVPRMAHLMLPRYIRVLDALPRTPSQKVEKYLLRREGITPDTWDREKAGIVVKRERIGKS